MGNNNISLELILVLMVLKKCESQDLVFFRGHITCGPHISRTEERETLIVLLYT